MANDVLGRDIAAFNADRAALERSYYGKWVVYHDGDLAGNFDLFELAAEDAVRRFGRGPYLIREVGSSDIKLRGSLVLKLA